MYKQIIRNKLNSSKNHSSLRVKPTIFFFSPLKTFFDVHSSTNDLGGTKASASVFQLLATTQT